MPSDLAPTIPDPANWSFSESRAKQNRKLEKLGTRIHQALGILPPHGELNAIRASWTEEKAAILSLPPVALRLAPQQFYSLLLA